jgi:hypothetical protein
MRETRGRLDLCISTDGERTMCNRAAVDVGRVTACPSNERPRINYSFSGTEPWKCLNRQ